MQVPIEKTNSSYGRWAVRVDAATIRFFWRKSEAVKFAAQLRVGVAA